MQTATSTPRTSALSPPSRARDRRCGAHRRPVRGSLFPARADQAQRAPGPRADRRGADLAPRQRGADLRPRQRAVPGGVLRSGAQALCGVEELPRAPSGRGGAAAAVLRAVAAAGPVRAPADQLGRGPARPALPHLQPRHGAHRRDRGSDAGSGRGRGPADRLRHGPRRIDHHLGRDRRRHAHLGVHQPLPRHPGLDPAQHGDREPGAVRSPSRRAARRDHGRRPCGRGARLGDRRPRDRRPHAGAAREPHDRGRAGAGVARRPARHRPADRGEWETAAGADGRAILEAFRRA